MRWFCAIAIFLGHFITNFGINNEVLHTLAYIVRGVPVFFLISGIFIVSSLERYDLKTFFKKRFLRIFPELWLCVSLSLVIILLTYKEAYTIKDIAVYIATRFTFFQFYTGSWLRNYGVSTPNGALWTITVNIQFYAIVYFLYSFLKNKRIRTFVVLILAGMSIDLLIYKLKDHLPDTVFKLLQCNIISFLWIFIFGMMLYFHKDTLIKKIASIRIPLILAYILWYFLVPEGFKELFRGVRYNVITTLLLLLVATAIGFSFKFRLKKDLSYGFFLYHMVVLNIFYHSYVKTFSSPMQAILVFVAIAVITVILAFISDKITHRLISGK